MSQFAPTGEVASKMSQFAPDWRGGLQDVPVCARLARWPPRCPSLCPTGEVASKMSQFVYDWRGGLQDVPVCGRQCSVGGDFYELSLGYFNEFYSRFIKRVFSLSFLRVLFSDLSKELSLFYLASFILYVISRVLVSDLASLLSSGSRTADRSS
jgi:hypothetical protein